MKNERAADDKKNLKRQRIKTYFLEAAKEIIIKEGYEKVSVRKVADMAGYSYATIYNYFRDLNELLWEVKEAMIEDIFEALRKEAGLKTYDIGGMKAGFRAYIEYYFKNPNIFKFFYFYPHTRPREKAPAEKGEPDFAAMWRKTFKELILEGKLRMEELEIAAKTIIYAMHGLIMLCLSNNGDLTEENVYKEMDRLVDYILLKK